MKKLLLVSLLSTAAIPGWLAAAVVSADSSRGAQVFQSQGCGNCHALNGAGPRIGPDLGLIADRGFTPAALAATMWNHAPAMWGEMRRRSVALPAMDEQQSADLFAFFYSLRFFEKPGDAGRGKAVFVDRKCSSCHGISQPIKPGEIGAKPVSEWAANDPLDLVETMWNHSTTMQAEMARNNVRIPRLTGQGLTDLLVYTRYATGTVRPTPVFREAGPDVGKALFESKGCVDCHGTVTHFLSTSLRGESLTDIAADMWNHGLDMSLQGIKFAPGEMREIASYIWFSRAVQGAGAEDFSRGAKVFSAKKCVVCHNNPASGAPSLALLTANGHYFSGVSMVSALTIHGPKMLEKMREEGLVWPRFSAEDMSVLIAYLNSRSLHAPQ